MYVGYSGWQALSMRIIYSLHHDLPLLSPFHIHHPSQMIGLHRQNKDSHDLTLFQTDHLHLTVLKIDHQFSVSHRAR